MPKAPFICPLEFQGAESDSCPCNIAVRQGENLSLLLFSIYLQDLKSFISRKCDGLKYIENMQKEHLDEEIVTYFKLYIFLYADDTVILAENPNDLQASLNQMEKYCDTFDLHINVNKTKILFFRGENYENTIFSTSVNIYSILWMNTTI